MIFCVIIIIIIIIIIIKLPKSYRMIFCVYDTYDDEVACWPAVYIIHPRDVSCILVTTLPVYQGADPSLSFGRVAATLQQHCCHGLSPLGCHHYAAQTLNVCFKAEINSDHDVISVLIFQSCVPARAYGVARRIILQCQLTAATLTSLMGITTAGVEEEPGRLAWLEPIAACGSPGYGQLRGALLVLRLDTASGRHRSKMSNLLHDCHT
jgi:hypothetical protein